MMKQKKHFDKETLMGCLIASLVLVSSIHFAFGVTKGFDKNLLPSASHELLPVPSAGSVSFEVDSLNVIQDNQHALDPIFRLLDSLRSGKDTVLTIVHLGDSHLQAGYNTGKIMRLMQHDFGNAGRGWISPLKLSKTNEPDDYFIRSENNSWVSGRITQSAPKCLIGPGGIGIQTNLHNVNLDVSIAPNNGMGYSFNKAILYRHPQAAFLQPSDPDHRMVALKGADTTDPALVADTFCLPKLTDVLSLKGAADKVDSTNTGSSDAFMNTFYGLSLTNGNPGVLYHSIGVNGALYENYTKESYVRQLALLKPTLLIISLGTNESFGRNFNKADFEKQIDRFVTMLKTYMPETTLMLTTPAECYKRTRVKKKRVYVRNTRTEQVAQTIVNYAREKGIACWDLFSATGADGSCKSWYKAGLFGKDRVHFTVEGYKEQGTLFYKAFIKKYNNHLEQNGNL